LKLKNITVKHLFIKLNNKIVLKINGLIIKNRKKNKKSELNFLKIKKELKLLNYFEKIQIKKLTLNNNQYNIFFQNQNLKILSNELILKAILNPDKFYINIEEMYFPKYNIKINNLLIEPEIKSDFLFFSSNFEINQKKAYLKTSIQPSFIFTKLFVKNFTFNKNLTLKSDINASILLNSDLIIKAYLKNIKLKYKNYLIYSDNTVLHLKNYKLKINNTSLNIIQPKKIFIKDLNLSYSLKYNYLYAKSPLIKINIKNPTNIIILKNNSLNLLNKNINFNVKKITSSLKDFNISAENLIFNKIKKTIFYIKNIKCFMPKQQALFYSPFLQGNETRIIIPTIKGNFKNIPILIINTVLSINKKLQTKFALINSVKIYNISYDLNSNTLTFYSNLLLNDKLRKIIKIFTKTKIPIIQTKGENYLFTSLKLNPLKIYSQLSIKNAVFRIENLKLNTQETNAILNNDNIKFNSKNNILNLKNAKIFFDSNGSIDLNKKIILSNIKLTFLLKNIIKLINYKEIIKVDLKSNTLTTKKTHILINLKEKYLIVSPLKELLNHTILRDFIDNGILYVTYKGIINIYSYFTPKLPIFFKHNNQIITSKTKIPITHIPIQIFIKNNSIEIINRFLKLQLKHNNISTELHNIDIDLFPLEKILFKNKNNSSKNTNTNINIKTINTNILYKNHKFLSEKANLLYKNSNFSITSSYKHSSIKGYSKQGYFLIEGNNFSNEEFKAFLPKFDFFKKIDLDFIFVKSPDDFYSGKVYIKHAVVNQLKTLNNVIAFINTIPSILSLSSPGFSSKGYKIKNGFINYLVYKNILYIKQAKIIGTNLDFYVKGYVDFNKNYIYLKTQANLKMKYKKIPVIGKGMSYLLFGKNGGIDVKIIVKGDINNPQVEQDLGKEILLSPFELFKRAVTLPFNLF